MTARKDGDADARANNQAAKRTLTDASRGAGYAFFDLDYTLLPYDTIFLFANYRIRRNPLLLFYVLFFGPAVALHACKLLSTLGLKSSFLALLLWRVSPAELERMSEDFVRTEVLPRLYPGMREEIERHRAEGRILVLNTASADFYAKHIAAALGFDLVYGTRMQVVERPPFFPRWSGPNNKREAKLAAMRADIPELAAAPPDDPPVFRNSYSYSDSSADLPLLGLAEHVIVVHPSPRLARRAESSGWKRIAPPQPFRGAAGKLAGVLRQMLGLHSRPRKRSDDA